MKLNQKLFTYYFLAGLIGGIGGSVFLWFFVGPEHSYVVLGFRQSWFFYLFPFVGAVLSGLIAVWLSSPTFGPARGAAVSFLAFLAFNLILGMIGPAGVAGFLGFSLFGFILFGWALVLIGGVTGWLVKRSNRSALTSASNKGSSSRDAQTARAL